MWLRGLVAGLILRVKGLSLSTESPVSIIESEMQAFPVRICLHLILDWLDAEREFRGVYGSTDRSNSCETQKCV
jgi:hypothetical protein